MSKKLTAGEFLVQYLAEHGPTELNVLVADAAKAGHTKSAMRLAHDRTGGKLVKIVYQSIWSLQDAAR